MRILFDISHPAHVNFFKHAIKRININKNHLVFVTCLRRGNLPAIVREEIEGVDITYIARHRGGILSIIFEANILKFIILVFFVFSKKIDFGVSVGSFTLGAALKLRNRPNIQFDDDPESKQNIFFENLTATKIVSPPLNLYPKGKNIVFNALKEWSYLSPRYFNPSNERLKIKGYIFVREVSTGSLNYIKQNKNIISTFADKFPFEIPVILSLENKKTQNFYPSHWKILQEPIKDIHSLMYYSKIVVSSGDSMAREGAMLGVPSIYCGIRKMSANNMLIDKGILFHKNPNDVPSFIDKILQGKIKIKEQIKFRDELYTEWDDVTKFIVTEIEKYNKE